VERVLKEIQMAVKNGCKEIWITSQDNAAYGLDVGERLLPELLKKVCEIPGKFFVRIGMMNPRNVLPMLSYLIEAYKNKKIYKFLHLPVQSGDNDLLIAMKRGYTVEDFEKIVKVFEKNFRFQLWTDVIVGYPGEGEKEFEKTFDLIKKVEPDWVNVSKFGKRPGTKIGKQLPSEIVKERSRKISELVRKISLKKNEEWIGWVGEILISEKGKERGQWIGRNFAYKPILIEDETSLGKFLRVKVVDARPSYLIGKVLN
jgi:MiaB/RimO family radical SAM methylthiotransferase